jgi:hypothetical protein
MRLLRNSLVGGSAPKPPGFSRFFPARMSVLVSVEGDRVGLSPAIPAAEPVARVASQQRSIPSSSGRLIINHVVRSLNKKSADGDNPPNFVSHVWGSPHTLQPYPLLRNLRAFSPCGDDSCEVQNQSSICGLRRFAFTED